MLIASILIGIIVISATTTISEVQSQNLQTNRISDTVETIKYEARKVNFNDQNERENFRELLSLISKYRTEATYWDKPVEDCFNVTITSNTKEVSLKCIN